MTGEMVNLSSILKGEEEKGGKRGEKVNCGGKKENDVEVHQNRAGVRRLRSEEQALFEWHAKVAEAARGFEGRWSLRALRRIDDGLATALDEQRGLFEAATVTGEVWEIEEHGAAMCRGWAAAIRAMDAAAEPDDAYLVGWDHKTGCRVAIGERAAAGRVAELHGERVVLLTADEVATMFASLEGFKSIEAVKRFWPGAEIVDVHHDQPAKGDWHVSSAAAIEHADRVNAEYARRVPA